MPAASDEDIPAMNDASGLAAWLQELHRARAHAGDMEKPSCVLLTAPPAAGKTCVMSQVVVSLLDCGELVPILVKVQLLQRRLLKSRESFSSDSSWNWLDTYLLQEHGEHPQLHRMLRGALMARRAVILLDGLDEGGTAREEIEQHVAKVLQPQGHVMLVSSRPSGIDDARFARFHRLSLSPLDKALQEQAVKQRLGAERGELLIPYLQEKVPLDTITRKRVTANPLMLSLVVSIFELRQGLDMPTSVAELYEIAALAMLKRGTSTDVAAAVATPELIKLLQTILFEAHVAELRPIEDLQLDLASLQLDCPERLAEIKAKVLKLPFRPVKTESTRVGH